MDLGEYLMKLTTRAIGHPIRLGPEGLYPPVISRPEYRLRAVICRLIPGQVEMVERTPVWTAAGDEAEYYESVRVAGRCSRGSSSPDHVASDCALAGLQIRQGTGMRSVHPVELLREAYGLSLDVD
jgi:hypothetical protein